MDLSTVLDKACCTPRLKVADKTALLRHLATKAAESPMAAGVGEDVIYSRLAAREEQGSTGFGDEIAIPHARIPGMNGFLLFFVIVPKGVDFDALDKKKVKLFFVILGPEEQVNEHLKILAALSRALSQTNLKKELLAAKGLEAMHESFLKYVHEGEEIAPAEKKTMKLLVCILFLEDMLYHILEYFLQEGVEGATILDSSGMGQYISNIPLFATFIGFMNESKNRSQTILALIPEDREAEIIKGIEEITGDMVKKQGAMVMTLPLSFYKGTMKML